jgi:hypothetical protein
MRSIWNLFKKVWLFSSLEGSFALNKWVGPGNPTNWRKHNLFNVSGSVTVKFEAKTE